MTFIARPIPLLMMTSNPFKASRDQGVHQEWHGRDSRNKHVVNERHYAGERQGAHQ
jgi:hypothetical protein